jgi:archaellum biogenesis ATPase FlaH
MPPAVYKLNGHDTAQTPRPKTSPPSVDSAPRVRRQGVLDTGKRRLADCPEIRAAFERVTLGTDEVQIGSSSPVSDIEIQAGSMADVMKLVAGIRYLVREWIPYGMLTMLLGPPGVGKSAFALFALVRTIVLGCDWFNGTKGPTPGYVLWCDTEGTAAITVQRIKDWKIPAKSIKVPYESDPLLSINLTYDAHLEQIEAVINFYGVKLVVIDSLRGAHDGDENSSRVAQVLQRLAAIAERTKAAIVVIHHSRKMGDEAEITAESSRGSNAIYAMVRSQLGIDQPDKESDWVRLRMLKENLGLRPTAIGYRITSTGLEFGPEPQRPRKDTQRDRAEDWLREHMNPGGWYKSAEILHDAEQFGFSANAIQRAREVLKIVKPNIRKKEKHWEWRLPQETATDPGVIRS